MKNWNNWDRSLKASVRDILQPISVDEVAAAVKQAANSGTTIRAVGAGHSWSPLVPNEGYVINLDMLGRAIKVDAKNRTAELEAGIRLREIGPMLGHFDLAMRNLGAITEQSLAGAVSTGTHGTGLRYGILGTQISGLTIIDANGNPQQFNLAKNPQEMAAFRLNLGCLGIIVAMTIDCVEAHNVELKHWSLPLGECLDSLESLYSDNERVRIYWFPGESDVFVNTMNRTDKPDDKGPVFSWFESELLRKRLMSILWSAGRAWPAVVGALNEFQEWVGFNSGSVVGPSYEAITTPLPPFHQECEVAVPIDQARAAIETFKALVDRNNIVINVPSEIRFVDEDDVWLSPGYQQKTCYIGAYTAMYDDNSGFFREFLKAMSALGARPHWGKIGAPTDVRQARALYPKFDEFAKLRATLDPHGVFLNPYLKQLFP